MVVPGQAARKVFAALVMPTLDDGFAEIRHVGDQDGACNTQRDAGRQRFETPDFTRRISHVVKATAPSKPIASPGSLLLNS